MGHTFSGQTGIALAVLAIALLLAAPPGRAQQAPPTRLSGTLTRVDGDKLSLKTDDGKSATVALAADAGITNVVPARLDDIKRGEFVGATAEPEAGDRWRATEVHIFPPGRRPGEGHYPWNTGPSATMTNADVAAAAVKAGKGTMTLTTGGKSYDFDVPSATPIVAMKPGAHSLLKKGARVSVFQAQPAGDGTYAAKSITVITARNWPPK